jgi:hypothetical protein
VTNLPQELPTFDDYFVYDHISMLGFLSKKPNGLSVHKFEAEKIKDLPAKSQSKHTQHFHEARLNTPFFVFLDERVEISSNFSAKKTICKCCGFLSCVPDETPPNFLIHSN